MANISKGQLFLFGAASFLAGVVVGFLTSPVKHGFGNNCGNSTHYHYGETYYPKDESVADCCCDVQEDETCCECEKEDETDA
jgi:hypothetical protein